MNTYADIEIHDLSSSTREARYLLSCNGAYYEASRPVVELLKTLQQHETQEEAVAAYISQTGSKYTPQQMDEVITHYISPLLSASAVKKRTFLYERQLFSSEAIDRFSDAFSFLFNKVYMAAVFMTVAVMDAYFFIHYGSMQGLAGAANVYTVFILLAFVLASSFFHELGHASACKRFGVRHGGIGFGLYLNFPVLYTDVTEVWKLRRGQRCVVNIAGVYFQCLWLILLLALFFATGNSIVQYMILTMNLGFLMTLNPFFRFDGYWIASDLLGVPNLRARSRELLTYLYQRMRRQPVGKTPYLLQIRPLEQAGMAVYAVVVNLFLGYYFFYIIPVFLYSFVRSFPKLVEQLAMYLANGATPPFGLLRGIVMQLLFLTLIGFFLWNMVHPFILKYRKRHGKQGS